MEFRVRKATMADVDAIEAVMRDSLVGLSSRTYDPVQVQSSLAFVGHVDEWLIEDGTYFVAEANGSIVGCGGWSRRRKLYRGSGSAGSDAALLDPGSDAARVRAMFVATSWARRGIARAILDASERAARAEGFQRLELMSMMSAVEMYHACGYLRGEDVAAKLEDGTDYPLVRMTKELA